MTDEFKVSELHYDLNKLCNCDYQMYVFFVE